MPRPEWLSDRLKLKIENLGAVSPISGLSGFAASKKRRKVKQTYKIVSLSDIIDNLDTYKQRHTVLVAMILRVSVSRPREGSKKGFYQQHDQPKFDRRWLLACPFSPSNSNLFVIYEGGDMCTNLFHGLNTESIDGTIGEFLCIILSLCDN